MSRDEYTQKIEDLVEEQKSVYRTPVFAVGKLIRDIGISRAWFAIWMRLGWIKTENINGKVFVTADALDEFVRRMKAGEFAKTWPTPPRKKGFRPGDRIEADCAA